MLFFTHILLGFTLFLFTKDLFSGGSQIVFCILLLFGSILPDIDSEESKIHRWSGIFGKIVTFFSKHRGFFHAMFIYVVIAGVISYFINSYYGLALLFGYFTHIIGDGMTLDGVAPLYPFSKSRIHGPVRVGGFVEMVVAAILILLILWKFFGKYVMLK